ncbi:hypothetical protein C1645_817050 [Glomus cerebriforme]|uniref:Uncharacterized protein n=1 Tax=Glomus cerebriforme TaxID=658196 RepID=A0A397TK01_9GLOM|nr:hypothetical protein C1645_817050 [Glomus cerebriforme]
MSAITTNKEQAFALIPDQRIGRYISRVLVLEEPGLEAEDNLSERDVKAISRTLVETASNPVILEITRASNKIQQERTEQRKNEGLHYPDHFSLESVKERLDLYVVSNTPDKQALADVMIMLCQQDIPRVFRSLEKNEERARQLLTWIQEAIISGALKDPGKPGSSYLRAVFASVVHGPKNLSKANTYASEAFRHSSDNHTSPSDRYTIVNFRRRGQPYDQAKPFWISDEN